MNRHILAKVPVLETQQQFLMRLIKVILELI